MAFFSRAGNILKQAASRQSNVEISAAKPFIFQAMRCMSSSKLFVGGLSYGTDEQGLREAFSKYGEVAEARVIMDRESGRSRGFGFITYTSTEAASSAIQALDGQDLHGRMIKVNYATEKQPRFGGGYGQGGGFSGGYGQGGGFSGGYGQGGGSSGGYGQGGGSSGGYGGGNYGSGNYGGNYGGSGGYEGGSGGGNYGVSGGAGGSSSMSGFGETGNAGAGFGSDVGPGINFGEAARGGFDQEDSGEGIFRDDDDKDGDYAKRA